MLTYNFEKHLINGFYEDSNDTEIVSRQFTTIEHNGKGYIRYGEDYLDKELLLDLIKEIDGFEKAIESMSKD